MNLGQASSQGRIWPEKAEETTVAVVVAGEEEDEAITNKDQIPRQSRTVSPHRRPSRTQNCKLSPPPRQRREGSNNPFPSTAQLRHEPSNRKHRNISRKQINELRKTPLDSNDFYGDFLDSKDTETTRLILLNTNNVGQVDKAQAMWGAVIDSEADIACITELGLDTTQSDTVKRHLMGSRRSWLNLQKTPPKQSNYVMNPTSSPYQRQNITKPGGVMTTMQGPIAGRVATQDADPAGRWSLYSINRSDSTILTVITAYQPCQKQNQGIYTTWHQQAQYFREKGLDIIDPRIRFRLDLTSMIQERIAAGEEILLAGDFNETMEEKESGIAAIANDTGLTDVYLAQHELGDELPETFGTHIRSKNRRIDLVLATESIAATVLACGYLPFHSHMDTDHRLMFVDLETSLVLGEAPAQHDSGKRFIDSKNLRNVARYLPAIMQYGKDHHLLHRLEWMVDKPEEFTTEKLERCDRDLIRAFNHGETHCQKQFPYDFSKAMKQAIYTASFYRTCICLLRTKRDVTAKLHLTNAKMDVPIIAPTTVDMARDKLREARANIMRLRRIHRELRIKMLDDQLMALDYAITGRTEDEARRLKGLKRATEKSATYRKFRAARNDGGSGLNQLDVPADAEAWRTYNTDPKQCDRWTTLNSAKDIAKALTKRNQKHFGQAHTTPFTIPPLSTDLGLDCSGSEADAVLEGTYSPKEISATTQMIINHLKRSPRTIELSGEVSRAEFTAKLRTWKEKTSTSPRSGMHLGHYRSLVAKHGYSRVDTENGDPEDVKMKELLDEAQDYYIRVHVAILNLALRHRYSLERWREIVNVMLRKETGNRKLHRLRVIHLYEADYNLLLGVKWRQASQQASDKRLLNPGQCGGAPGSMTSDPVFLEELHHELGRLTRKPQIIGSEDAQACFDRIIMALAATASRKFGVHKNVVVVTAKTLQDAKFRIKTELGISESYYENCEIKPIYGIGQGSQNGPTYWLFISSILFDCHKTRAFGAKFTAADGSFSVTIYLVGFVDDTNSSVNNFDAEVVAPTELIERKRKDTQSWSDLLWASGGRLELSKCTYYLVDRTFTRNGAPVLLPGNHGPPLIIKDSGNGTNVTIPRLSTGTAHKILGHYREPAGNEKAHWRMLQKKCQQHRTEMLSMSVSREEAACHYFVRHLPSVTYPLGVSFLSDSKLDQLQVICGQTYITKMGFNRKTAKAILYAPESLGGRGLRLYKVEQGIKQITNFLRHWRHGSQFGDMLRIAVSWFQFSIGTSFSAFDDTTTEISYMEGKLLPSIRANLQRIQCKFDLDDAYVVPAQREHDQWIMDRVLAASCFSKDQRAKVNYCRLYLRVTTLSDIVMPNGMRIDSAFENGTRSKTSSTPKHYAINQAKPGPAAWTQWRRALRLFSKKNGILIGRCLGRWLLPANKLRQNWHAYLHTATDSLFVRNSIGQYNKYVWHPSQQCYQWYSQDAPVYQFERSGPVSVRQEKSGWTVRHQPGSVPPPTPLRYKDFKTYLQGQDEWERDLFRVVELSAQPDELWDKLFTAEFVMGCSDGSVKQVQHASFAWVLGTKETILAKVAGPVRALEPTSFRAEAYGILSFLRFALRLCRWLDRPAKISASLHTDSESVIKRIIKYREWHHSNGNATLHSDWDVINEIYHVSKELGFKEPRWVKGHQDDKKPFTQLTLPAQLNCKADELADKLVEWCMKQQRHKPFESSRLEHNPAQLIRDDGEESYTITRAYAQYIRRYATFPELRKYLRKRFEWNDDTIDSIDWGAHKLFVNRNKQQQLTLIKMLFRISPTNERVHRYDPLRSPKCPYCTEIETEHHMVQCDHKRKRQWRAETLVTVRKACERLDTHIDIQEVLLEGLHAWMYGTIVYPEDFHPKFRILLDKQSEIGWDQLSRGRFTGEWAYFQGRHYRKIGADAEKSGKSWVASIATVLFGCWATMWDTRCKTIHGIDEKAKMEKARERAVGELRMLCNAFTAVPMDKREIFPDMATMLKATTATIQDWISLHGQMIRNYVKAQAQRQRTNTRAIWDHFQQLDLAMLPLKTQSETEDMEQEKLSEEQEAPEGSETTGSKSETDSSSASNDDIQSVQFWTESEDSEDSGME